MNGISWIKLVNCSTKHEAVWWYSSCLWQCTNKLNFFTKDYYGWIENSTAQNVSSTVSILVNCLTKNTSCVSSCRTSFLNVNLFCFYTIVNWICLTFWSVVWRKQAFNTESENCLGEPAFYCWIPPVNTIKQYPHHITIKSTVLCDACSLHVSILQHKNTGENLS